MVASCPRRDPTFKDMVPSSPSPARVNERRDDGNPVRHSTHEGREQAAHRVAPLGIGSHGCALRPKTGHLSSATC
jgi:hypothetical protein